MELLSDFKTLEEIREHLKNFKKVFYYGMWDGKRDLDQADQFLKKPVLNIMPPIYSNMFESGKTIISEKNQESKLF